MENKFTFRPIVTTSEPTAVGLEAADRTTPEHAFEQLFADKAAVVAIIEHEGIQGIKRLGEVVDGMTDDGIWEDFMKRSMVVCEQTGRPHQPVIEAAAQIGTTIGTKLIPDRPVFIPFMGWSHAVCHLFENYGSKDKKPSLLNAPEHHGAAELLITEGVSRAVAVNNIGNMDRILRPLIRYNTDHTTVTTLAEPFTFKPAAVSNEQFIDLYHDNPTIALFLKTNTPQAYFVALVQAGEKLPMRSPKAQLEILGAIQKQLTPEEWNEYLMKHYKIGDQNDAVTLELLEHNVSESIMAKEQLDGLYVDIDDTLIVNNRLNRDVVYNMEMALKAGRKVVLFTGGDPETQSWILRMRGLSEQLIEKIFPVQSKMDYKGKILEELIDDTDPAFQGFSAATYKNVKEL